MATFIDRMMRSEGLGGTSLFPLDRGPGYPYFCQKLVDASKQLAKRHIFVSTFLPSATKLQQGNIFTGVCQSFCSQRGCLPQCTLGYTPLGRYTPFPASTLPGSTSPEAHPRKHTPPGTGTPMVQNFLSFMQFFRNFGKIVCWHPHLEDWHSLLHTIYNQV